MTPKPNQLAAPCPFCLSEQTEFLQAEAERWFVACGDCGATGPVEMTPLRAHARWAVLSGMRRGGAADD